MQSLSLVRCHGAVLVNLFESTEHFGHKVPGGHDQVSLEEGSRHSSGM